MHLIGVLFLLILVSACGKSNSNAGIPNESGVLPVVENAMADSYYMASFQTLNGQPTNAVPGSATLQKLQNSFHTNVTFYGGAPLVGQQHIIYEGKRCPRATDDYNYDGQIDNDEGSRIWGNSLVSLDTQPEFYGDIDGRVIVIHSHTLPVACGIFKRVARIPADINQRSATQGIVLQRPEVPTPEPETPAPAEEDDEEEEDRPWYENIFDWLS